jgi:hypothetical protein
MNSKTKKESFITYNPNTNSFLLSPKHSIHQRSIFVNNNLNKTLKPLADDNRTSKNRVSSTEKCSKSNLCNPESS